MADMVTISKTEYDELLRIKRYAEERAQIEHKKGKAWENYERMKAFCEFLRTNMIGYYDKKRQFDKFWKDEYIEAVHS